MIMMMFMMMIMMMIMMRIMIEILITMMIAFANDDDYYHIIYAHHTYLRQLL
jgi:hypothetical protein